MSNIIDKITDKDTGESRIISPAAEDVRVDNENFEGDNLEDVLDEIAEGLDEAGSGGYTPPHGGIPKTDLAPAVQQTLDDVANKVDKVPNKGLSSNDYADTDKAKVNNLKPVATSGSYNDLTDKPTIPTVPTMDSQPTAGNTTHMVSSDGVAAAIANAGTVKTISVNGVQQPNNNGNVNITVEAGAQGPKGDTGNVQVDGNGNVLIVNNVDDGGAGAALSAEMGKRLALKSGTFAAAWARAQVIPVPFSFLWVENISGVLVRKPIWHIGNSVFVDAAGGAVSVAASAVPNAPTFSEQGGSVSSGAEITITPYTDSVLHYIVGGTEYTSVIPVTVVINQAQVVIEAWCENAAGSSSHLTQTYTANAPAAPVLSINGSQVTSNQIITRNTVVTITATEGTLHYKVNDGQTQNPSGLTATVTCSGDTTKIEAWTERDSLSSTHTVITFSVAKPNAPTVEGTTAGSTVVSRGGSVTIRGVAGGKLCYRVNDATPAVEVNPVGDSTPTATVSIATNLVNGQMKIEAWNVKDGETSDHTTETFTMAALTAPVFSKTGQLNEDGEDITISGPAGATIYYTEDGSTPTDQSTEYTGAIHVATAKTINAIAYDDYGHSEVTTAVFTIPVVQRFVYKISVPAAGVSDIRPPFSANGELYLCKVDWGDGESTNIENNGAARTFNTGLHKHSYTGTGEIREVTIKITGIGDSAPIVPAIQFLFGNDVLKPGKVVEIVENSLACATAFGKIQCPDLRSICANALANNSARVACFHTLGANLSTPLELPNGLLKHLTTNANGLSSCTQMFQGANVKITSSQMAELEAMITNVTDFSFMFKDFKGICTIPANFFANIAGGVTTIEKMIFNIQSAEGKFVGDALDIYSDLAGYNGTAVDSSLSKLATGATVAGALGYIGLTNVNNSAIPHSWKSA